MDHLKHSDVGRGSMDLTNATIKETRRRYKSVPIKFQGRRVGLRTAVVQAKGTKWPGRAQKGLLQSWHGVLVSWMPSASKTMKLTQFVHFPIILE